MKKLSALFLSLVAIAATVTSCNNDDNSAPPPTVLELVIQDAQGAPVSGASVQLYGSSTDWANGQNQIATQPSDASGKVKFSGLEAKQYYFRATKAEGCLSNDLTIPVTFDPATNKAAPIAANKTTSLNIPVVPTTVVTFINNSNTNNWGVAIGTTGLYIIPKNTPAGVVRLMPADDYTITMIELNDDNTATETTPKEFPVTLDCGQTTTVTVP